MAHYAFLDENNIVTEVIVGKDEDDSDIDWEQYYGDFRGQVCKRTSYNMLGGVHARGGVPFRKNYAGIGFTYDYELDAFIPPKPFDSWIFNPDTCCWEAPIPRPTDGDFYGWNEDTQNWDYIEPPSPDPVVEPPVVVEEPVVEEPVVEVQTLASTDISALTTSDISSLG